jgi:large subunit ribosomal protein L13
MGTRRAADRTSGRGPLSAPGYSVTKHRLEKTFDAVANPQVNCPVGRSSAALFVCVGRTRVKTFSPRPQDIERRWYVIDAQGAVLGRLATETAKLLRGKHKPIFAPHADTGDHVVIVNAGGVVVTGGKEEKKVYYRHSGYPGGLKALGYSRLMSERPVLVVEKAVRGMLPKNRLGRQMFRKLAVYEGAEHPHQAQKPVPLALGDVPKWEGLPKPKPKPEVEAAPQLKAGRKSRVKAGTARGPAGRARKSAPGAKARDSGRKSPARAGDSKAPTAKGRGEKKAESEEAKEAPSSRTRGRKAAAAKDAPEAAPAGRLRRARASSKKEDKSTEES